MPMSSPWLISGRLSLTPAAFSLSRVADCKVSLSISTAPELESRYASSGSSPGISTSMACDWRTRPVGAIASFACSGCSPPLRVSDCQYRWKIDRTFCIWASRSGCPDWILDLFYSIDCTDQLYGKRYGDDVSWA